jgi:DNA-binding winged helix-turn-helix (wHTH) protein
VQQRQNGATEPAPVRIGDWRVEPDLGRIARGEEVVQLRPRAMEVLLCLADRAGRLASKQYLIDSVWRTEFVAENVLTHVIAELRRLLGDDADRPSYIETIPRRGYRLIAPVSGLEPPECLPESDIPRFKLESEDGEHPLVEGENLIGRGPEAAIRIDDSEVSRRHARIVVEGGNATIEDLGSKNGTFLRGNRLRQPARLADADEIWIGLEVARFRFKVCDDRTRTEKPGKRTREG